MTTEDQLYQAFLDADAAARRVADRAEKLRYSEEGDGVSDSVLRAVEDRADNLAHLADEAHAAWQNSLEG
jgi:hypothetical protein